MRYDTLKFALAAMACLSVISFAAIPEMRVTTKNNQDPTVSGGGIFGGAQTMKYVQITNFVLTDPNNSRNNLTLTPEPAPSESDSIRVRGNSTAGIADKRPYRIKFDKKQGLFGKEKAKSWVLLANYYDQTLTLNAIAFRLGQKMGLAYTPSSQHVNLYINNNYKGIYQLTEQIQVNPGRVDIDTLKGFLVEFDYHDAASDEVKFTAAKYSLPVFIKSPEVTSNFNASNTKIKWVKDTIDLLTNKMSESGFPTNGYRDMIDLESYAKYVLIQQLLDNFDFNSKVPDQSQYGLPGSNYAYKDVGTRIYAGPLWDFDLAAGVTSPRAMSFNPHYTSTTEPIKPKHAFYQRLWDDPVFLAKFKKLWDKHKSDFDAIPAFIDSLSNALKDNVANNKCAIPSNLLGGATTLTTQTYTTEVGKLKDWWGKRVTFFGSEITKMNIDTSKDIEQTQPSSSSRPSSSSNQPSSSSSSQLSSSSSSPSSSSRLSSSSSRSSSSSGGTTPIFGHSQPQQHGLFVRGRIVNIYTQEPSSVKLSVFDLRGKTLFSGNLGTGSNITWNSEGLGISKVLIVVVEAKGESGRTYKFSGRILP
ncbi:MAG: CotH kinase family protein [Candidatus Fibromonas sp.]|nr:CotH kinase family protein [Candidatus Fibromonas sp.]